MIPDEAIEAAAKATVAYIGPIDWDALDSESVEHFMSQARAVLEAALPHLSDASRQPQRISPTVWPDVPRLP